MCIVGGQDYVCMWLFMCDVFVEFDFGYVIGYVDIVEYYVEVCVVFQ